MYAFTPDGQHLALLDAFALTRVTFPGKVKTDRKVAGGPGAPLSLDAAGAKLLAYNDDWDRSHLFAFPALTAAANIPRFQLKAAWLYPGGQHFVTWERERGLGVLDLQRQQVARHDLGQLKARDAGKLSLGRRKPSAQGTWELLRASPDGTFAVRDPESGVLTVGKLGEPGRPPELLYRAALQVFRGHWLHLQPTAERTLVAVHDPAAGEAYALLLSPEGKARELTLKAAGLPQLAGRLLVYPRDAFAVVRLDLDSGKEEVLPLPPEAEAAERPGQVLAHPLRTLYLPWHAEHLVDLAGGAVISRKLPAPEQPVRRYALERVARGNEQGKELGLAFSLVRVEISSGRYMTVHTCTPGDGSPAAKALAKQVYGSFGDEAGAQLGGFRRGGYGSRGYL